MDELCQRCQKRPATIYEFCDECNDYLIDRNTVAGELDQWLDRVVCMDALELLRALPDASVDAVITDPPYNMTELDFEAAIDWSLFWRETRRILRQKNSPTILFSQQPFTTDLIVSNRASWRYEIIWEKTMPVGYLDANRRPLRCHENIQIFADALPDYFPQMEVSHVLRATTENGTPANHYSAHTERKRYVDDGSRFPRSVWTFAQRDWAFISGQSLHPTQKPIALIERLILTYTQSDWMIVDPFLGSGTTAVAARTLGRHYIGCDISPEYVALANRRLAQPFTLPMPGLT